MKFLSGLLLLCFSNHFLAQALETLVSGDAENPTVILLSPFRSDAVSQNQKLELGINLPKNLSEEIKAFTTNDGGLNPYNPKHINVEAHFRHENGFIKKRYGFYYRNFQASFQNDAWIESGEADQWRIRFAPHLTGQWSVYIRVELQGEIVYEMTFASFTCIPNEIKGRLQNPKHTITEERQLSFTQNGGDFITRGNNISNGGFATFKPSQQNTQLEGLQRLAESGGNFTRFELPAQAALPDWPNYSNYSQKQDEMFAFDEVIDFCDKEEIYYIVFRHHVEMTEDPQKKGMPSWDGVSWYENPYRSGFKMEKRSEYFTNEAALEWQKNGLRYMDARWGYSPKFAFFGFSEIDNWYKNMAIDENYSEDEANSIMFNWYLKLKKYMQEELQCDFMFVNSYARVPELETRKGSNRFLDDSDIVALHIYEENKSVNAIKRYNQVNAMFDLYKKPVLIEEAGINGDVLKIYCCTGIDYHNSLWAGLMMGSTGTAMDWWWNRGINAFDYLKDLQSLQKFTDSIDFENAKFTPQRYIDETRSIFNVISGKNIMHKAQIENFALKSENDSLIIGWVHNATFYWRNLNGKNACVQSLLDSSTLSEPCMVEPNYDLNRETNKNFQNKRYKDKYSDDGGALELYESFFEIKDVSRKMNGEKITYQVDFYRIQKGEMLHLPDDSQVVQANRFGKLKIMAPPLDYDNPDYAYKITPLR